MNKITTTLQKLFDELIATNIADDYAIVEDNSSNLLRIDLAVKWNGKKNFYYYPITKYN